jgi:hypothetical protein
MHPPPNIKTIVKTDIGPTLLGLLFVDFIKLTPASKAEKAISQLWGTLTCESLTEDLIGLNMFVPDSGSMVSTISVATLKSMHPPPNIKTLDDFKHFQ